MHIRQMGSFSRRLTKRRSRKLLEVQLRSLLKMGKRLLDGLSLGGCTRFRIEGHKAAFFGGNQNGCKKHDQNVSTGAAESTEHRGAHGFSIF